MPSDILGSEVMDAGRSGTRSFRFIPGPVFAQLLMADEINRASPRTQSALLQAMQEYHVTIAGARHDLPQPFHVLATQNPLEQEGTYPLPEAQLDRFLMQIDVALSRTRGRAPHPARDHRRRGREGRRTCSKPTRLKEIQHADPPHAGAAKASSTRSSTLVRSARPGQGNAETDKHVAWGPGPRASQALMLCARARALYDGRLAPSIDDVVALAEPVLQHRMALTFAARAEGMTVRDVVAQAGEEGGSDGANRRGPGTGSDARRARPGRLRAALVPDCWSRRGASSTP